MRRSLTHAEKDLIFIACLGTALKLLLMRTYRSTDFEVHRNWLAITSSKPLEEWYFENTSQWTLDYPPFFAYFEWILAQAAKFVDPGMLNVTNLNYASDATVFFQRLSVIISDFVLLAGIWAFTHTWPTSRLTESATSRCKVAIVGALTFLNPGLVIVDHIHFQYNGMMLGILLISISFIRSGRDLEGAAVFAALCLFKHIFLYMAPVYGIYLLRHYCFMVTPDYTAPKLLRKCRSRNRLNSNVIEATSRSRSASESIGLVHSPHGFNFFRFLQLVGIVLFLFGVGFGPLLLSAALRKDGFVSAKEYMLQILSRLFPFGRGLCHAYWAPNLWVFYNLVDKLALRALRLANNSLAEAILKNVGNVTEGSMTNGMVTVASHSVLPNVPAIATFVLTLLAMTPALWRLWQYPHPKAFTHALVYSQMCSFMLGYHVHEKAILVAIIPLGMLAADSAKDAKVYLFLSWFGHFALFPLLFTPLEEVLKPLLLFLHTSLSFVALHRFCKREQKSRRINQRGVIFYKMELLYVCSAVPIYFFMLVHTSIFGDRLPFLPLLLISSYNAVGLAYTWVLSYMQLTRKLTVIRSYQNSPAMKAQPSPSLGGFGKFKLN